MSDAGPASPGKRPLSLGRRLAVVLGVIVMGFTGACTLLIAVPFFASEGLSILQMLREQELIVTGLLPFGLGLLIVVAALKVGR